MVSLPHFFFFNNVNSKCQCTLYIILQNDKEIYLILGNTNNTMGANPQQQQQQQLTQQQQMRLMMQQQSQQQNQQQTSMGMQNQQSQNQTGSQLSVSGVNQPNPTQGPHSVASSQASASVTSGAPQATHAPTQVCFIFFFNFLRKSKSSLSHGNSHKLY